MLPATPLIAQDFSEVTINTVPVAGNVSMLIGQGGNIGVSAGPDGVLIIDDQFAPLAGQIRTALAALGSDVPQFLLNTHFHGDHTGGNAEFGAESIIVAHENVRVRLLSGDAPARALPVVTYDDDVSLHFNGEEITLIHMPRGHTDTDSVVMFADSNVIHMGDHFFNGGFPFVDLGSGGTVQGYISNLELALSWIGDDTAIIPGHGSLASKADLLEFYNMIHADLGIPKDYLQECDLPLCPEPVALVDTELDFYQRPQRLTAEAFAAWQDMRTAAAKDGVTLFLISAFRDIEYQANLIANKLDKGQAIDEILQVNAAPGFSEHHTGRAVDIGTPGCDALVTEFENTHAFQWLKENAGVFGFVLSYPPDNSLGIIYEPWHWCFQGLR